MAKEKHLAAAERNIEAQKRRKRKKVILLVLIGIMIAAYAAEIIVLKSMTSVDKRFIRSVERGVAGGWESGKSDMQLREQGKITDTSFIDAEYEAAREFANKAYDNKDLKKLAKRYINDLKKCRKAASLHDPESDEELFWADFAEPYTDRLMVLRELYTGEYGVDRSWDEYPECRDEILLRAWTIEKASSIIFERVASKGGIGKFCADMQNDSGFDLEYIIIDVEMYNSNNKVIGTAEVFKENIDNGSCANLTFYYNDKKTSFYRVTAVDCRIAQ